MNAVCSFELTIRTPRTGTPLAALVKIVRDSIRARLFVGLDDLLGNLGEIGADDIRGWSQWK